MPLNLIREFLKLESASGILLFFAAALALVLDNSLLSGAYQTIFKSNLLFWINDGLMTLFFLLVGLELKREFVQGELSTPSNVMLPAFSALGGMLVPALIFAALNFSNTAALRGWPVPVATDIAFALGVLSLFGKKIPTGLRLFLLTLAIFDDLGAIIIIAFFFSHSLSAFFLLLSSAFFIALVAMNILGVQRLFPYLFLGFLLWICVLKSGVHPTIAGVLLALTIPTNKNSLSISCLHRLEQALHPWVAYGVMPLFALANAGLSLKGLSANQFAEPVVLGTALGLFVGKQCGVLGFAWILIRSGWAKLPKKAGWAQFYGVSLLCGIGFTMSLFLGTLAFQDKHLSYLIDVKLGVLSGSLLSAIAGALVLKITLKRR